MHCHADAGVESVATMVSPIIAVAKANFIFCLSVSGALFGALVD
jgi:hypothetical protein